MLVGMYMKWLLIHSPIKPHSRIEYFRDVLDFENNIENVSWKKKKRKMSDKNILNREFSCALQASWYLFHPTIYAEYSNIYNLNVFSNKYSTHRFSPWEILKRNLDFEF